MKKFLYGISGGSLVTLIILILIANETFGIMTLALIIPGGYISDLFVSGKCFSLSFSGTSCSMGSSAYDYILVITNMIFYFIIGAFIGSKIGGKVSTTEKLTPISPLLVLFALLTTIALIAGSVYVFTRDYRAEQSRLNTPGAVYIRE